MSIEKSRFHSIENYYLKRIDNSEDYKALGWENREGQYKRFSVLNKVIKNGMTILDVGCGLGNLLDFFKESGHNIHYTGVDLIDKMIQVASEKKPYGDFRVANIFKDNSFEHRKFDIVYASGIFNIDLGNNDEFLNSAISTFDRLSKNFIIFNLLHIRSNDKESGYYYNDPEKIKAMIIDHEVPHIRIQIVEDYLDNDFTVIIQKR